VVGVFPAGAEWFADLYGGAAFTESTHISLDGKLDGMAVAAYRRCELRHIVLVGRPVRYWFESLKLFGLGLDASYFDRTSDPRP